MGYLSTKGRKGPSCLELVPYLLPWSGSRAPTVTVTPREFEVRLSTVNPSEFEVRSAKLEV